MARKGAGARRGAALLGAAVLGAALLGAGAQAKTLDDVKARGTLRCGAAPNSPGFAALDSRGTARGFDVDFCRAIAAAALGDAAKHAITPLGLRDGFATLAGGGVDVLTHRFTWTFNRDNGAGLEFVGAYFYDGQGFVVRKDLGVTAIDGLNDATICVAQGSTTELNIADYFGTKGMRYKIATFADLDEARNAYEAGRCDAWSNDRGSLAARSLGLKARGEHMLLPGAISKEPIGPMVRANEPEWSHVVRWTLAAVMAAEELGLTSANVEAQRASSANPEVRRLLGVSDDLGQKLGLPADWAYQAIKQVGNYGEIYARNVGKGTPLDMDRGLNASWKDGGLIVAPPFR